MSATFRYRSFVRIGELASDECTVHRADNEGRGYWMLWLGVKPHPAAHVGVPVNPNGDYAEDGPGGRTWAIRETTPGAWFVAPSVNVLGTSAVHPGEHPTEGSIWHENVVVEGVPLGEVWAL